MSFLEDLAGSFLNRVNKEMDVRSDKADERVEEQEDLARQNLADVKIRGRRATEATKLAYKAKTLGANDDQIAAAMSSGMAGIADFVNLLETARSDMSGGELGQDDISALIDLQGIPDMEYGTYEEMANTVYGANKTEPTEMAEIPGWAKILGLSADEEAKRELASTPFASGYTVQQINDMAAEPDYQGLPGLESTTMTYKKLPRMGSEKGMEWSIKLGDDITSMRDEDAYKKLFKTAKNEIQLLMEQDPPVDPEEIAAKKAELKARTGKYIRDRIDVAVRATADVYKTTFFKNGSVISLFDNLIQEGVYSEADIAEMTRGLIEPEAENPDLNDPRIVTKTEETGAVPEEKAPVIAPPPEGIPGVLVHGKKYKGKYESKGKSKDGVAIMEPILVDPRPPEDEVVEERRIASGRIVKVFPYQEWNKKYGDTHDPLTGYPLPIPGLEKYFGVEE